jgi:cytoskeletal protein RodZ
VDEFSDQIGGRLKRAREQAGLEMDDVAFRTRIPKSVVVSLEAGDFAAFSSSAYAKSFLEQYSDFLEVDATPWLQALEPASYVSGDLFSPLCDEKSSRNSEWTPERPASSSLLTSIVLFAIFGAILYSGKQAMPYIEKYFDAGKAYPSEISKDEVDLKEQKPRVNSPLPGEALMPISKQVEPAIVEQVPRASIVRE